MSKVGRAERHRPPATVRVIALIDGHGRKSVSPSKRW
jgi:hypothetical protein